MMQFAIPALAAVFLLIATAPAHSQTQCWAARDEQDGSQKPQAAAMRKAVLAAEDIIRKDQAYLDSHIPVRMRTMISTGPSVFTFARMLVNAYPEYSTADVRVWRGQCDVIPQADRIDAAVGQIGIFFNIPATSFMPPGTTFVPKFEGTVSGYPHYNGWVFVTKDGRLPWIPKTLGQRLDREIAAREKALTDWMKDPERTRHPDDPSAVQKTYETYKKRDPKAAELYLSTARMRGEQIRHNLEEVYPLKTRQLEKAQADVKRYRAGFSPQDLAAPAVWGDPTGQARKQLDAKIQQMHALKPEEQQEFDALNRDGKLLQRQAQDAVRAGNQQEAQRLRAQLDELAAKAHAIKLSHQEHVGPEIAALDFEFNLTSLRSGDREHAMGFVSDPDFFDRNNPYRIKLITVLFSTGKRPGGVEWMKRAQENFDFTSLAALLDE